MLERLRAGIVPANPPEGKSHVHPSQCWIWTGPVDGEGKGIIYNQEKGWPIHRLLYTIQFGPIKERVMLYTTCGVARCCNPFHYLPVERGPIPRPAAFAGFTGQNGHAAAPAVYPRCRNGHQMSPENTYVFQGKSMCRDCRAAAQQRYRGRANHPDVNPG